MLLPPCASTNSVHNARMVACVGAHVQGKTSRWAVAWSFAVDANLAAVPLARPVNPALAAPIVPKRSATFSLKVGTVLRFCCTKVPYSNC